MWWTGRDRGPRHHSTRQRRHSYRWRAFQNKEMAMTDFVSNIMGTALERGARSWRLSFGTLILLVLSVAVAAGSMGCRQQGVPTDALRKVDSALYVPPSACTY